VSDTVEPNQVENTEAKDPGSFAPLQTPLTRPGVQDTPRTLTGIAPLGDKAESAAVLRIPEEDEEHTPTGTGDRVSGELPKLDPATALGDATDNDDEPTTVFSTLFPELAPKRVSVPSVPPPPRPAAGSKAPPRPSATPTAAPPAGSIEAAEIAAAEANSEDPETGSPTQEAQILDFALQKLSRSEPTPSPLLGSVPPHPPPPLKSSPPPLPPRASSAPSGLSVPPPPPPLKSVAPPVPSRRSAPAPFAASAETEGDRGADVLLALASSPSKRPIPPAPPSIASAASVAVAAVSLPPPRPLERATDPSARTVMASNSSDAPWSATPARPAQTGRSLVKSAVVIFALSALATVLVLRLFTGGDGSASVTAVDSDNRAVEQAQVLVDGKVACSSLPCSLDKLAAGKHRISVQAGQLQSPEQIVAIRSGKESKVTFSLSRAAGTAGLHVRVAAAPGLHVFIDGEDKGEVPVTLGGLVAGDVTLKIAGNPLYAPFSQTVSLKPGTTLTFEPKLVPVKAMITIRPGDNAQGAFVEVVGGDKRQALFELPAKVEVAPGASYKVRATRRGYRDFDADVAFSDTEAEKEVRVDLDPAGSAVPTRAPAVSVPATPTPTPAPAPAPAPKGLSAALAAAIAPNAPATPATPAPVPAPAATAGSGTLNINSIPISNVLVDGRPVGPTPRQMSVPAGKHSITFVHPTLGRKSITVNVNAGKTALAATKF
jgi:hypothetical protein